MSLTPTTTRAPVPGRVTAGIDWASVETALGCTAAMVCQQERLVQGDDEVEVWRRQTAVLPRRIAALPVAAVGRDVATKRGWRATEGRLVHAAKIVTASGAVSMGRGPVLLLQRAPL